MIDAMKTGMLCVKRITHVLEAVHTAHGRMQMNNRSWYGISLAVDGRIVYKHNGKRFISDSSHIVILPKNQSYELECIESGRFTVINFLLENDISLDTFQVIEISNPDMILTLYKKLETIFRSSQSSKHAKLLSCFYEMLALIIEEHEKKRAPFVLKKAIDLIEDQICNPEISNISIADELHISEIYLRKLFNKYLSTTPKQYIQDLRSKRAEELLICTSNSISSVSEMCGYSTVGMFCRAFKKRHGVTPTEYRNKNKLYVI